MCIRDRAGTLLCMGAISGGELVLNNAKQEHITPVVHKLEEAGAKITLEKNRIILKAPKKLKAIDVKTMPYPGFPTDMQSVFVSLQTVAKGTSMTVSYTHQKRRLIY